MAFRYFTVISVVARQRLYETWNQCITLFPGKRKRCDYFELCSCKECSRLYRVRWNLCFVRDMILFQYCNKSISIHGQRNFAFNFWSLFSDRDNWKSILCAFLWNLASSLCSFSICLFRFVSDRQRMNVALTRARHALYVFGHMDTLKVVCSFLNVSSKQNNWCCW